MRAIPIKKELTFIEAMADAGIQIDVFGNDWEKFITIMQNITIYPPVYGDEFWKVLRRYRVQLNLMRMHNEDSHNMRSFEVPAVGGIMLAPDTPEHRLFFNNNQEVFLFSDLQDAVDKAKAVFEMAKTGY